MPDVKKRPRPAVLIVLDGLGIAPDSAGNAVTQAHTPILDMLTQRYPAMTLRASGEAVGLPWGEVGNSEVGHITIGAGRVHYQDLPRIDRAIEDGSFFENEGLKQAMNHVKKTGGTLHLWGILSSGHVHGSNQHCTALLEMAKREGVKNVALHIVLDGRDSLYNSGLEFVQSLMQTIKTLRIGNIATLSGRFYAMDRDNRWERTEKAYRAMVQGQSQTHFEDPIDAIKASYAREIYDEEFAPTVIEKKGKPVATFEQGDALISWNYRADRSRQLMRAFALPTFYKFERPEHDNALVVTMTSYERSLPVVTAFAKEKIDQTLSEVISAKKMVQLHIAETEKYAHVTYFLNGKVERPWPEEDHVIIPSPRVSRYDEVPEMSSRLLTDRLIREIKIGNYDAIFVNFANPDMVAHTGNVQATIKAVESMDECLGRIVKEVLKKDGCLMITADHGNAEEVKDLQSGGINKDHSTNPVPLWIVANHLQGQSGPSGDIPNQDLSRVPPIGTLSDIAPTFLHLLHIPAPELMTGAVLLP